MATKLVAGVLVILALAAAGTVGVAYYNDPTIFDSTEGSSCCPLQRLTGTSVQPSMEPASSCCDLDAPKCETTAAESKP